MNRTTEGRPLRVFVEYRVIPERREEYEARMRAWQDRLTRLPVAAYARYEGWDQPHLMVETYLVPDEGAYRLLKELRTGQREGDALWQLGPCVEGGVANVHVWAFVPHDGDDAGWAERIRPEQGGRR